MRAFFRSPGRLLNAGLLASGIAPVMPGLAGAREICAVVLDTLTATGREPAPGLAVLIPSIHVRTRAHAVRQPALCRGSSCRW